MGDNWINREVVRKEKPFCVGRGVLKLLDGWEKAEEVDSWWWKFEEEGKFSVSSSYASLQRLVLPQEPLERTEEVVFDLLWKSPAPSKVVVFSWQLLFNRIPTKDNLLSRCILAPVSLGRCEFFEQAA